MWAISDRLLRFNPKDVKSIAEFVQTRTPTQVRTHAQKYFLKKVRAPFHCLWFRAPLWCSSVAKAQF